MADYSSVAYADTPVVAAIDWIRDLLTGSLGLTVAVLAVAWLGLALLQGRIPERDGARIVVGCFVLFGAPVIADALVRLAQPGDAVVLSVEPQIAPPMISTPRQPPVYDPYAGASVPNH